MTDEERRQELVDALWVAPFISADESLRRCREAAAEIVELAELAKAAWRMMARREADAAAAAPRQYVVLNR